MSDINAILALAFSICSLIATYFFNKSIARAGLRLSILNEARKAFNDSSTAYIDWLADVNSRLSGLLHQANSNDPILRPLARGSARELLGVLAHDTSSWWVRVLEEYEVLLPKTAIARKQLLAEQRILIDELYGASSRIDLHDDAVTLVSGAAQWRETIMDQMALVWDLRVYVQNVCLGELTGHQIPERTPRSDSHPVLRTDSNGRLRIERATRKSVVASTSTPGTEHSPPSPAH